jgi:hypothetical protein
MTVRRMSALRQCFCLKFDSSSAKKPPKDKAQRHVRISPKAEVRGSNPFGRASDKVLMRPNFWPRTRFAGEIEDLRCPHCCHSERWPMAYDTQAERNPRSPDTTLWSSARFKIIHAETRDDEPQMTASRPSASIALKSKI